MPIIAVVGEPNKANAMMKSYLEQLIKFQKLYVNLIASNLSFNPNQYPDFKFMDFATKEDLYAYTSAENYTFNGGNEGVCYGF